jgi:hypothetical protein
MKPVQFLKMVFFCFRYPKPGRTNPFVNVYVARVDSPAAAKAPFLLQPPRYFDNKVTTHFQGALFLCHWFFKVIDLAE